MSSIFLIEGPVGAGKSTYAARLSREHRAPHLDLDEWMVTLFSPDRPSSNFMAWYAECKQRCISQIWAVAKEILNSGSSVVLELGLVQVTDRAGFYSLVDVTEHELHIHLLDTPLVERRRRVVVRNEALTDTYKMQVSDEMFEIANRFWEAPTEAEYHERDITVITAG